MPSYPTRSDKVVWRIFWKVFKRLCGPPTRSIGPTVRSAGLLVGRTHLSGTDVSLVGGDSGVPMSHTEESTVVKKFPRLPHAKCMSKISLMSHKLWHHCVWVGRGSRIFSTCMRNNINFHQVHPHICPVCSNLDTMAYY
jgi:hypothetical protein